MSHSHTVLVSWRSVFAEMRNIDKPGDPDPDHVLVEAFGLLSTPPGSQILANHGHRLLVSDADVAAGVDKTYSIQGNALHDHQITITAADFAILDAVYQTGPVQIGRWATEYPDEFPDAVYNNILEYTSTDQL